MSDDVWRRARLHLRTHRAVVPLVDAEELAEDHSVDHLDHLVIIKADAAQPGGVRGVKDASGRQVGRAFGRRRVRRRRLAAVARGKVVCGGQSVVDLARVARRPRRRGRRPRHAHAQVHSSARPRRETGGCTRPRRRRGGGGEHDFEGGARRRRPSLHRCAAARGRRRRRPPSPPSRGPCRRWRPIPRRAPCTPPRARAHSSSVSRVASARTRFTIDTKSQPSPSRTTPPTKSASRHAGQSAAALRRPASAPGTKVASSTMGVPGSRYFRAFERASSTATASTPVSTVTVSGPETSRDGGVVADARAQPAADGARRAHRAVRAALDLHEQLAAVAPAVVEEAG